MKQIKVRFYILSLLMICSSQVFSQHSVGVGLSIYGDSDYSIKSALVSYNYRPDSYIGLEIYGATGGEETIQVAGTGIAVSAELDYLVGSKLKFGTEINNSFLYVSGGYNVVGMSAAGGRVSVDVNGASLGVGVDFDMSKNIEGGLSYQNFYGDIGGYGLGFVVRYKF